jgi:phage tail-like protein
MANYYPPVGFHFKVEFQDMPVVMENDVRFSEVSGLSVEVATEEVAEGGENRFTQKYPIRNKYPELVLKRGLLRHSGVWDWARACIEDLQIQPKNLFVKLLNNEHEPLLTWNIVGAYPTRWAISDLNASSNTVAVESLQLFYQYFTVTKS